METCYQNDFANITFDPTSATLLLTWGKFVKGENFRNTMLKFYDLTAEKQVQGWCFDSRKQSMVAPEDQQWTVGEIVKRGYHTNAIRTAIVMPESLFMEVTVNKISDGLEQERGTPAPDSSENYRQFTDLDEAMEWLRSKAAV
jgi:hypothetical protein